MIYYVSGAINGLPVDSVETDFKRGIRSVKDLGFYALSPLDIPKCEKAQYHSWECCLRYDLVEMLKCDGLYMLSGWQQSKGAQLEHFVALQTGMKVMYEDA